MDIGKVGWSGTKVGHFMQQIPNAQLGGWGWTIPQGMMTLPLTREDWKKLSRETQIKVLDELGILSPIGG